MHKRSLKSFGHALRGIRAAWQDGWNFRIHCIAAIVLVTLLFYFNFSHLESAILITLAALVISAELINTAIERTLDIIEANHHPLVGKIKDMAAGAVLVVSLGALLAGVLVFIRHINGILY